MPKPSEAQLEAYLARRVKAMGGITYKWTSPGTVGVPDRIVVWPGRVDFVEMKTKGGRLSAAQKQIHRTLAKFAHPVYTLWSKEDVDRYIQCEIDIQHSDAENAKG